MTSGLRWVGGVELSVTPISWTSAKKHWDDQEQSDCSPVWVLSDKLQPSTVEWWIKLVRSRSTQCGGHQQEDAEVLQLAWTGSTDICGVISDNVCKVRTDCFDYQSSVATKEEKNAADCHLN